MEKMFGNQVVKTLKESAGNYIHDTIYGSTLHNLEADELGNFSHRVLNNLIEKGEIIKVALGTEPYDFGYYQLTKK